MNADFSFNEKDIQYINQLGLDLTTVMQQIEILKRGNLCVHIAKPATFNDGIIILKDSDINIYLAEFDKIIGNKKLCKFVPASGAATRMFKDLFQFIEKYSPEIFLEDDSIKQTFIFLENIQRMPFYDELENIITNKYLSVEDLIQKEDYHYLIQMLLSKNGLNYASLPKALLLFHSYLEEKRTAFEEHLVEGSYYAKNMDNTVNLHFTISPEHENLFNKLVVKVKDKYESRYGVKYNISFSFQSPSTNTISLTQDNKLFRDENECLEFRPGGHGSLLKNLLNIDADVVFIKNIDNITTDNRKRETIIYKKILTVLLLKIQKQCFNYLGKLENKIVSNELINEIQRFIETKINTILPSNYSLLELEEKRTILYNLLNRPMRVCGMVKRENEPGGGPFWIINSKGELSLQIVESSEINLEKPDQLQCFESSEFFNPVDLVCGLKNYKGEKFDVLKFADNERCFISLKSKDGKIVKVLEHPGLWNGAMSDWITLFVAVPISTFTPVKTINDLLREEHQNLSQIF